MSDELNDTLTALADATSQYAGRFAEFLAEFLDAVTTFMATNGTELIADIDKRVLVGDITPDQADALRTVINDVMKENAK